MPRIIRTHETDLEALSDWDRSQVYNGLDVCVTRDVYDAISPQLDETTGRTYALSRSLQGPTLEMRIRGVLVDQARKYRVINELAKIADIIEQQLDRIVIDGVGMHDFNWRSPDHLQALFYKHLGLKPVIKYGKPTTDRGAREKLEPTPIATQIVKHINAITDIGKKISVLRTDIDRDGRIRTSYNIAGTNTGRFSSSLSEFGTGGNLQNVEESLRSIFIADPGWKFGKADAKSGESYAVGAIEWNRFGDGRYLDAIESGDIHTAVARMVWPEQLPWTGDVRRDKALAESPFYRGHSYRFMCKKLGHGSNYNGKAYTLAEQSKLPIEVVSEFQGKYFEAFPAHRKWQDDVDQRLRRDGYLVSLTGRRRWFFGRRNDPATLREAIAYDPQCSLADLVNLAMIKIWRQRTALIMMHDHDALTFMYREELEDEIVPVLLKALVVPVPLQKGRELRIPYDIEVGWNKGHYCCGNAVSGICPESGRECHGHANVDGLRGYTPGDSGRKRQPIVSLLDEIMVKELADSKVA